MSKPERAGPLRDDGWRTVRFIDDAPLVRFDPEHFDESDAPRCGSVADQLARQLIDFIRSPESGHGHRPPRIGLFGGLGQGKSTVINWVLTKCEQSLDSAPDASPSSANCHRSRWQQLRVERFDAAFYKSDELEHEFDRLLGTLSPRGWPSRLITLALCSTLLLLPVVVYWLLPDDLEKDSARYLVMLFVFFAGVISPTVLKRWSYWWRSGLRERSIGSPHWWLQARKMIGATTEILVVDNLDRANLKQQRAVLRALYKHLDHIGYAVVVCFDETPLLASETDPESPRELLRKSIHIEARMPVRVVTDTLRLAWMALSQAARLNPDLAPILDNPRAVDALARTLELLAQIQPVGPRVAKHTVNNALFFLAHVQSRNPPALDDWRAVLRLLALHTAMPQLRRYGDALRAVLQRNSHDGLSALTALIGTAAGDDPPALAERIFNATRAYHPADFDWSPWVVLWHSRGFTTPADVAEGTNQRSSNVPDFETVNHLSDGLTLLINGKPRTEFSTITGLLPGLRDVASGAALEKIEQDVAAVLQPLIGTMLIQLEPVQRERLLSELWAALIEGVLDWLLDAERKKALLITLSEWMLIEALPSPARSQQQFNEWWHVISWPDATVAVTDNLRLLTLLPPGRFHLADTLAYAALAKGAQHFDLGPEQWLAGYDIDHGDCLRFDVDYPELFRQSRTDGGMIKRLWPPISPANERIVELLSEHCAAWRTLKMEGSLGSTPLEYLLLKERTFGERLQEERPQKWLPALSELFFDGHIWGTERWLALLRLNVITGSELDRNRALRELNALRSRLTPLWRIPAAQQDQLKVQILLASSFPDRSA